MSRPSFPLALTSIALACAVALPTLAQARPVTIETQLHAHGAGGSYLALYLTDARGAYAGTLAVAYHKAKYLKHLSDWQRLSATDGKRLAGITGASVGAGRTLKISLELADTLIDAGYELRLDAAEEDLGDTPSAVRIPLTRSGAGQNHAGRGALVRTLRYQLP